MPPDDRSARPRGGSSASKDIAAVKSDGEHGTARDPFTQPDPLLAEWRASPSLLKGQRRQLEGLGVAREAVHRAGSLGWARVSTTKRLYMPSNAGDVAIIMPVWAGPAPSIYQAVERPLLDDLIAWHPEEPTRGITAWAPLGSCLVPIIWSLRIPRGGRSHSSCRLSPGCWPGSHQTKPRQRGRQSAGLANGQREGSLMHLVCVNSNRYMPHRP